MEINRHNYEAFLLDQLEGKLSVEQQQELERFLQLNPDCAGELSEVEPWLMEAEPLRYENSASLKREFPDASSILTEQNFDMFSIARMENDLADEQIRAHQAMLEMDDQKAQQWVQWQQSRLHPEFLVFPGKERLFRKKGSKSRLIWMSVVSAAAALALLMIVISTDQDLPTQEAYIPASQETVTEEAMDAPTGSEIPAEEVEPVSEQRPLAVDDPPVQKTVKNPEPVRISQVPVQTMETTSQAEEALQPVAQVLPGTISASTLNHSSMIGEVDTDRIEPLHIPAVPLDNSSMTLAQLYDQGLQEMAEEYVEEKDISLWTIANAGINGINKLAGSDISLLASRDEEGEISGFRLKSKRFSFTRPLGREE